MAEPRPKACQACPWRLENQGKRVTGGWYSKANLKRLWNGLRRGERMSCHPTDPRMADEVGPASFRPAPDGTKPKECTGALIVVHREFMRMQEQVLERGTLRDYIRERPFGLTATGVHRIIDDELLGGRLTVALGGKRAPKPDLRDPAIGYPVTDGVR